MVSISRTLVYRDVVRLFLYILYYSGEGGGENGLDGVCKWGVFWENVF